MRKLRNYFHSLFWSASDPAYYFSLLGRPFSFSLFFYCVTIALVTIITTIGWHLYVFPDFLHTVTVESNQLIDQLPTETIFKYTDGTLRTENLTLPFTATASARLRDWGFGTTALVLDTKTFTLPSLSDHAEPIRYSDITDVHTASFTRKDIKSFVRYQIAEVQKNAVLFSTAFYLLNVVSSIFIGALVIAFFSLIVQSISWLAGIRILYRQAFRWGLHIYPIALLVDQVSIFLAPKSALSLVHIAYLGMSLCVIWYGYTHKRKKN